MIKRFIIFKNIREREREKKNDYERTQKERNILLKYLKIVINKDLKYFVELLIRGNFMIKSKIFNIPTINVLHNYFYYPAKLFS